ncbi:hypothetical protein C364_01139 [Cryptococcus neoformans Bt63]|nr:hypothetical protein C364_01139 [Cryptococcus neoformans var. grubii Bt63]
MTCKYTVKLASISERELMATTLGTEYSWLISKGT